MLINFIKKAVFVAVAILGIGSNHHCFASSRHPDQLRIFVMDGHSTQLEYNPNMTLAQLKSIIGQEFGYPTEKIEKIIIRGKVSDEKGKELLTLEDDKKLSDYPLFPDLAHDAFEKLGELYVFFKIDPSAFKAMEDESNL
jgi:hypothetical protein